MLLGSEVQREKGELRARAARHEEDLVVIAEPHEFLDVSLGLRLHGGILLRTVADLEDGHAAAAKIEELRLRLFEHGQGQRRRPRVEVVDTICFQGKNLLSMNRDGAETRWNLRLSVCSILARKNGKSKHSDKRCFFHAHT